MTYDELAKRDPRGARAAPTKPFGVNLRADQPDVDDRIDLLVREGVQVASFAQAPGERLVKQLQGRGRRRDADGRRAPPRREGRGVGRRRGDRPGRRGRRPHRHGADLAAAAAGRRRRRHPGARRRRLLRRSRPRRRARVRRGRRRDGHALPAHHGEHRARRGQGGLPRDAGHRHGRDQARSTATRSG